MYYLANEGSPKIFKWVIHHFGNPQVEPHQWPFHNLCFYLRCVLANDNVVPHFIAANMKQLEICSYANIFCYELTISMALYKQLMAHVRIGRKA